MSTRKDVSALLRQARRRGWLITPTRSGHWRLEWPPTGAVLTLGSTPRSTTVHCARYELASIERQGEP